MTVFITHCWRKRLEPIVRIVQLVLLWACLIGFSGIIGPGQAWAGNIEPKNATLVADERGQALTAEFAIELGPRLEEAVGRGVPLHFRFEFELTRKRWYWADEHIAGRILNYRLSYHALTRQYRLTLDHLHQNFETLGEALRVLGRVARLHVVDKPQVIAGEPYLAAVRLSLDHSQLPKPLQIDALADRDWRIEATTLRWDFIATAAAATAVADK